MQPLQTSFRNAIKKIGVITSTPDAVAMPSDSGGRAYIVTEFNQRPHAGTIHWEPVIEKNHEEIQSQLQVIGQDNHALTYMGAAGAINLGNIVTLKPDHAILFDINPFQTIFWEHLLNEISICETPELLLKRLPEFEKRINAIINDVVTEQHFLFETRTEHFTRSEFISRETPIRNTSLTKWAERYLACPQGPDTIWLEPEHYRYLREMVLDGRIGPLTLDITNAQHCDDLADFLKKSGRSIDVLYTSNIMNFLANNHDWIKRHRKGLFEQANDNMRKLMTPARSWVISCSDITIGEALIWPRSKPPLQAYRL